ncbi:hypothetical protein DQE80_16205, partial [Enterococcus sp. HPCN18]
KTVGGDHQHAGLRQVGHGNLLNVWKDVPGGGGRTPACPAPFRNEATARAFPETIGRSIRTGKAKGAWRERSPIAMTRNPVSPGR